MGASFNNYLKYIFPSRTHIIAVLKVSEIDFFIKIVSQSCHANSVIYADQIFVFLHYIHMYVHTYIHIYVSTYMQVINTKLFSPPKSDAKIRILTLTVYFQNGLLNVGL